MAENSKIEWTDHTFNPWRGCTMVSAGCDNCYAERDSKRFPAIRGVWGKYGTRVIASDAMWKEPLKWNRKAAAEGVRKRVFCASLADVFEGKDTMPEASWEPIKEARMRLFQLIDETKNLDWLLLTKRPRNIRHALDEISEGTYGEAWNLSHMPNVWIGTSVEDQKTADERIPELLKIPAKVRFLSMEPLLGPVDLNCTFEDPMDEAHGVGVLATGKVHWVIVGGESGPNARPMHPIWAESLRDQCQANGVPFFFKQWGQWGITEIAAGGDLGGEIRRGFTNIIYGVPRERDGHFRQFDEYMSRYGKKKTGRLLDGQTWDELPA